MPKILIGNIKGPKGDVGPQGAQGLTGERGPQGPVGPMPPLVNNGTATVVGASALDAVQGNPNVAGTLAAQVSKLNEEATKVKTYSVKPPSSTMPITFYKNGKTVSIIATNISIERGTPLKLNLPSDFRIAGGQVRTLGYVNGSSNGMGVFITGDNLTVEGSGTATWFNFNISYICE